MLVGQRVAHVLAVLEHDGDAVARDELETGDPAARPLARKAEQLERLSRRAQADEGGRDILGLGKQFQDRAGDDAERALRADEEVLQVVAGIVLAQPAQPVPDPPVGKHDFEPEHQIAGIAVGQHRRAAGIGADIAADLTAALRTDSQGEQPVDLVGRRLHGLEHAAGIDRNRVVDRVDVAHLVHAPEAEHDLMAGLERDLRADQTGIAALGHDRRAGLIGDFQNAGHFFGAARAQHHRRLAEILVAPFSEVRRHVGRIGNRMALTDNGGEAFERFGPGRLRVGHGLIHSAVNIRRCRHAVEMAEGSS